MNADIALPLYYRRTLTPPSTITPSSTLGRPNPLFFKSTSSSNSSPKTFLPRASLFNSPDHTTNFQQLLFFRECFHKTEFWDEIAILDRMYYKNKSQHRQAGYFQRLGECRRIVARIKELNIANLMDELVQKFYSGRKSYYQLMSKTQFMAFALITIGLCSRLSLLSKSWENEYVDCYRLLENWIKVFPKEEACEEEIDYENQLPVSIDSVLDSSSPDIPSSMLSATPYAIADPISASAPSVAPIEATSGPDIGEVIQRRNMQSLSPTEEPTCSISASPKLSSGKKHERSSPETTPEPSPKPRDIKDQQPFDADISGSDPHSYQFDGSDTITKLKPSTSESNKTAIKQVKKAKALPDLDDIFKSKKNKKSKDLKQSGLKMDASTTPSPALSAISTPDSNISMTSKSSVGSKSNFDSIFGIESGPVPDSPSSSKSGSLNKTHKNKMEIDDIFGAIKKPKKKSDTSEIDSIFGPPKKKKKKPAVAK
ncbi:hypothetical protein FBU30_006812 [Linnemannia zychae]|nr:hypothetical protein FBU30_006812 [Linnemannia zychae]